MDENEQDGTHPAAKPIAERDPKTGKFLTQPAARRMVHRAPRVDIAPILDAITTEFSSTEIRNMLRQAYAAAWKNNDWKGMMAVVQFVAYYSVGKPVQRSVTANISREDFIDLFRPPTQQEEEEDDGEG